MQPEDIIQNKEWHELNDSEKLIVQELASSEQEYNLMKKIFLVSREELMDVPEISPHVHQQLKQKVSQKKKSRNIIWYAAAAAVVILFSITIFLRQPLTPGTNDVVKNIPVKTTPADTTAIPQQNNKKENENTALIKPVVKKKIISPAITPDTNNNSSADYVAVNTTVMSDPSLLSLVTELN
jgi:hypothetical protein